MDYRLIATFAVAAALDFLVPIGVALWLRRRFHIPWKYLGYGAIVFLGSQILTRTPAVLVVQSFLTPYLRDSMALLIGWFIILAITAGVFEEVGRFLGYKYLFKDGRTWHNALMYGTGHGGLESMVVGLLAVLSMVNYLVIFNLDVSQLPPPQAEQIQQAREVFVATPWWTPLLGAFERAGTLVIQISLSVLVLQCFLRRSMLWLWIAIGYHAIVDFAAVMFAQFYGPLAAEGAVAVFAALSLYFILRLKSNESGT